jgi:integrase
MQLFRPTYRDRRTGVTRTTKVWYARINGKRHSLGVTDKRVAQRRASELLLEIEGDVKPRNRSRRAPQAILDHLDAFERSLNAKGCTPEHVALVVARLKAVFEGTAIRKLEDAPVADVDGWLAAQQVSGEMSARTRRHHASHLRQFGRFLVREAIVADNPFADVTLAVHVESDRRLQRRALTADEMRRLLESVAKSPTVRCRLPGPTRRLIYFLGGTTGLRRNELGALTPESFDFSGPTPQVRVDGQHTKNRRRADLPLRSDLAAELQAWLVGKPPGEPVFPIRGAATHTMIAKDLKEAGIEATKNGRRVDFHALRTTTVTSLALSGVPLAVAQKIARHSTPTLTANVYAVVGVDELQKAVEKLPSFVQRDEEDERGQDVPE